MMDKKVFSKEVHFSYDISQINADLNSHLEPDYLKWFLQYPYAEGFRDVTICQSAAPPDVDGINKALREGKISTAFTGWLLFITTFCNAARLKGMTPLEYADDLYDTCDKINEELGYRAEWIEAYGEIGNSISWPAGKHFTKKEALDYFRRWLKGGQSLTEHWNFRSPTETISFYTHAKSRNENLRELPIYYTEATLFAIQEAFRLGFPLVIYESQCGTQNRTQLGTAFVRGGAKMYDAFWGSDFSPWTYHPQGDFSDPDNYGRRKQGMTPDHQMRAWLFSYLAGANTLLHEVSYCYFYSEPIKGHKILSDYGHKAMQLYALSKGVLAERGKPVVPFAVMLEEEHGYRGDAARELTENDEHLTFFANKNADERLHIWSNRCFPPTRGDWQVHRLFSELWTVPETAIKTYNPGWPDNPVHDRDPELTTKMRLDEEDAREYNRFLADTQWADSFDVITEDAELEVLNRYYQAVLLAGDIQTDNGLWQKLKIYAEGGKTVVLNVEQLDETAKKELGFDFQKAHGLYVENAADANGTFCVKENLGVQKAGMYAENEVFIRDTTTGTPLVLKKTIGNGQVLVCLIENGLTADAKKVSAVYSRIIDTLYAEHVGIFHCGAPCEMMINRRENDTLVTLFNHTGKKWDGEINFDTGINGKVEEVRDLISDFKYPEDRITMKNGVLTVKVSVTAYEYKVLCFGPNRADEVRYNPDVRVPMKPEYAEYINEIKKKGPAEVVGTTDRFK